MTHTQKIARMGMMVDVVDDDDDDDDDDVDVDDDAFDEFGGLFMMVSGYDVSYASIAGQAFV